MSNLTFSGHETFACRQYWLKKGYDFVADNKQFSSPDAVVHLGVGNNMVRSIRYWLRAFDILNDGDQLTEIGNRIFSENGWDPFLEDEGTLWLLHYLLNNKQQASIYHIIFSDLRKTKPEFTRKHFFQWAAGHHVQTAERPLKDDFQVFCRTYLNDKSQDVEDGYAGLLSDLNLMREIKENKDVRYNIGNDKRPEIPAHIILFSILNKPEYGTSISFENLYADSDGPGIIFALSKDGLIEHLEKVASIDKKNIFFKDDPLARELQFKKKPDPIEMLNRYYEEG